MSYSVLCIETRAIITVCEWHSQTDHQFGCSVSCTTNTTPRFVAHETRLKLTPRTYTSHATPRFATIETDLYSIKLFIQITQHLKLINYIHNIGQRNNNNPNHYLTISTYYLQD